MEDQKRLDELAALAQLRLRRLEQLGRQARLDAPFASQPAGASVASLDGPSTYFYRPDELLCTEAALARVEGGLRQLEVEVVARVRPRTGGFVRLVLAPPGDPDRQVDLPDVLRRLRAVVGDEARPGRTPQVSPNHLFFPAPWNTAGPATEPELPRGPVFEALDPEAGRGVRVAIIDTGLVDEPRHTSLVHDLTFGPDAFEDTDYDGDGYLDPVAGHGTFIAALVRQLAPAASLHVEQMVDRAGIFAEVDLAERLNDVLDLEPDIINLSLGGHTDLEAAPIALAQVWDRLVRQDKTIVVAAAGNTASSERFWPAASEHALGVGALGVDGRRAWFSNHGGWVDVWAPGEHLRSAYAHGTYRPRVPGWQRLPGSGVVLGLGRRLGGALPGGWGGPVERLRRLGLLDFDGEATWSGTSFATPLVVGAIAATMSSQGLSARQAQQALVKDCLQVVDIGAFGAP